MGAVGFILGMILGIMLAVAITAKLIVSSNYMGDKKGTRFDYGSGRGATYYAKTDRKGNVSL